MICARSGISQASWIVVLACTQAFLAGLCSKGCFE